MKSYLYITHLCAECGMVITTEFVKGELFSRHPESGKCPHSLKLFEQPAVELTEVKNPT